MNSRSQRVSRFRWWLCMGATTCALTALSAPALAQDQDQGLALDRFDPAPAGDRMFGVPSPYVAGDTTLHLMLLGDYAHNPLVLRRERSGDEIGAIVANQLFLHLNGTVALWNRVAVNLDVPLAVAQSGDGPQGDGVTFPSPSGAALGDIRLGLRFRALGEYYDPLQLGIGGYFWIPSGNGDAGSFVGDGSPRGMPMALAGGILDRFVWSTTLGFELRENQQYAGVTQGTLFHLGVGAGVLLGEDKNIQIGPELTTGLLLDDLNRRTSNAEILFGGKYRFLNDFEGGLGLGAGLTSGVGTPDFRGVFSLAYTPEVKRPIADRDRDGIADSVDACPDTAGVPSDDPKLNGCPPPDRDHDGILDQEDACPDVAGVPNADPKKNGCPPPGDRDKDGILDDVDACPDVPGVPSQDPKLNGCPPPDRDGDGVPDPDDACPDIPGLKTDDPATNGCPGDRDGDTIRDDQDACPEEKGKPDPDPKKNGCPVAVRVTEKEIVILQQVQFDTGKATIKPVSDPLLDEVAQAMKDHPEIVKIEVQGHTDNRGPAKLNEKLSKDRADAVMKALIQRQIEAGRLTAKGYGPSVPIGDNKTAEGRQKNRRVQFNILEKKPKK